MTEVAKAWYLFSFSFGCWTCLNLLLSKRGDKQIKRSMMVFIALLLLPALNAYVTLVLQQPVDWLLTLSHQLTWAYGPLVLLHVRHVLLQKTRPSEMLAHALPFIFSTIFSITEWRFFPVDVMVPLLFVQLLAYGGYIVFLLKGHQKRIVQIAQQHQNSTYYWLLYLVGGLLMLTLVDIGIYSAVYLGHLPSSFFINAVASMMAIFVNTIALFALYQPDVFMHEVAPDVPEIAAEVEKTTFRIIELTPQAAIELDEQLQQLVAKHKPHLDEDISLNKLAALLGVTSHHLSELLNVHKAISFYDFLNDLRYQESLQMLEWRDEDLTIADIAYRSGFNNRNSFYKVFKEKTGVTPTQYKKAMR